MLERLRNLLHSLRALDEIDGLSDRELSDIGLSRAEMAELATMSAAVPARMARMAALFGLTEEDLQRHRPTFLEALEVCAHCGAARTCAHRFAEGSATPSSVGFCPNVPLYRDLAAE